LKVFFITYFISTVIGALALHIFNSQLAAVSFVAGAAVMMLNVAGLHFAWSRILVKKQVALPVGVIVIKYAILGFIIYRVATENLLQVSWFAAGFSLVLISSVVSILRSPKVEP
jgi:hypothetical protein